MKNIFSKIILLVLLLSAAQASNATDVLRKTFIFKVNASGINEVQPTDFNSHIDYNNHTTSLSNDGVPIISFHHAGPPNLGTVTLYYRKKSGMLYFGFLPVAGSHANRTIYNLFHTKVRLWDGDNIVQLAIEENVIWVTTNRGTVATDLDDNNETGEGVLWKSSPGLHLFTIGNLSQDPGVQLLSSVSSTVPRRLRATYTEDAVYNKYGYADDDLTQPLQMGNAVQLDGVNDHVSVAYSPMFNFGLGDFCIEAWVKYTGNPGTRVVAGRFNGSGNDYWLGVGGDKAQFSISGLGIVGTTLINDGNWHHVAGVRSASVLSLYVDGKPDAANVVNNRGASPGGPLTIGTFNGGYHFPGTVDEVRIWRIARSQDSIRKNMNHSMSGFHSGLIAYYTFDQETACGTNTGATTVYDISRNSQTATLTNMALTGTTSNWVPGVTLPSFDTICVGDGTGLGNYESGGVWSSSNSNIATVNSDGQVSGIAVGSAAIKYTVTSGSGCSSVYTTYITVEALPSTHKISGNGLHFDGVNDHVVIPVSQNIPAGNSNYTLEAWIKPAVHSRNGIIGWGDWWGNRKVNALRLGDDNTIHNYWWGSDLIVPSANLADGAWHHIAATFDGTTRKIYVDGIVKGQDNPGANNVTNTGNITIGKTYDNEFFNGNMDEMRIWNVARSATELQMAMHTELSGSEPGLVAHYNFNQGIAGGTNTVNALPDRTGNSNNGILTNFALTGASSNWVDGSLVTLQSTLSNGLSFDGTNDYISVATSVKVPAGNSNYTMEAWIKPTIHGLRGIVGWGDGVGNKANGFTLQENNVLLNNWWGNNLAVPSGNLADGVWHHVGATFDGTTRKIYIDGILKGQDNPTGHNVTNTGNITIGTSPGAGYFSGSMEEVRIWNIARSQADIQSAMYTELSGREAGLAAHYTFNHGIINGDNAGTIRLSDNSLSINTGKLNNFALTGNTSNWVAGRLGQAGVSICRGGPVQLNNKTLDGTWSSSDPEIAEVSSTGQVTGLSVGTAYITYTKANASGCEASASVAVTITHGLTKPVIAATATRVCWGASTTLSTTPVAGATYKWSTTPNGASIGSLSTLTVKPTAPTTYYVTVTNSGGCYHTSDPVTIDFHPNVMNPIGQATGMKQIAVNMDKNIHAIGNDNRIYVWFNNNWINFTSNPSVYASSMVASYNIILYVGATVPGPLYVAGISFDGRMNIQPVMFNQTSVRKVAGSISGQAAVIDANHGIWKWNGGVGQSGLASSFTQYPNTDAADLAIDASGRIWYIDRVTRLSRYLSAPNTWVTIEGFQCDQIACDKNGAVLVTGLNDAKIYKWDGATGYVEMPELGTVDPSQDFAAFDAGLVLKLIDGVPYRTECAPALQRPAGADSTENKPVIETAIAKAFVKVYPNPNNGSFNVAFTQPQAAKVTLRLMDIQGRVVHEEIIEKAAGSQTYQLAPKHLTTGIYFLKINTPGLSKTETISVQQ